MRKLWFSLAAQLLPILLFFYRQPEAELLDRDTAVTIADEVVAEVDPRFVSLAIDTAQVVGGPFWSPSGEVEPLFGNTRRTPFDFERPALRALTAPLSPAYLRIGGSEADRTFYDLSDEPKPPPAGYEEVLTRAHWDGVGGFAKDLGLDLMFTLNAGVGPRTADGQWSDEGAAKLIAYTRERDYPVKVWELGNEVHAYPLMLGLSAYRGVRGYLEDLGVARKLIDRLDPDARLAGPASAFWPVLGEPLEILPGLLEAGGGRLMDLITWHYYPMQSSRCPVATRRADPSLNVAPHALAEIDRWAAHVESSRDAHAAGLPVWLGETGNAQCGGAPGISDRFAGTFWWLDQLARLARRGQQVVVRQTLVGSNYGLLAEGSLEPRPDYWGTLLFKRLMGTRVLRVERSKEDAHLGLYAHCRPGDGGGVTLLALNLHAHKPARLALKAEEVERYTLTAPALDSDDVALNGSPLVFDGRLPALDGERVSVPPAGLDLPPQSITFLALDEGAPNSCGA